MSDNFQEKIFQELLFFLEPILEVEGDPEQIYELFEMAGWDLHTLLGGSEAPFMAAFSAAVSAVSAIEDAVNNPPESIGDLGDTLQDVLPLFQAIKDLPTSIPGPHPPEIDQLVVNLLERLLLVYLMKRGPFIYRLLEFLQIIYFENTDYITHNNVVVGMASDLPHIDLGRIGDLIDRPGEIFADAYWPEGFGDLPTVNQVAERIFSRIAALLHALKVMVFLGAPPGLELPPDQLELMKGMLSFSHEFPLPDSDAIANLAISMGLVPESEGGPGAYFAPAGSLVLDTQIDRWDFHLKGEGGGQAFQITGSGVEFFGPGGQAFLLAELGLSPATSAGQPAYLVGSTTGTRFEVGDGRILGKLVLRGSDTTEYKVQIELEKLAFVLAPGDGDGFLQEVLPADGMRIEFNLLVGWSNRTGFYFEGGGGLEVLLPVHVDILGVVQIDGINLAVLVSGNGLQARAGINAGLTLGPFSAVVENMGLQANLTFPREGGNLGPVNLELKFLPPRGIGMSLESGLFTGGGFLLFDTEKEEYAGILHLEFSGVVSVTAIGLLNTKLPGGQSGFSLLIIISAEFTPIQLGFGFTLIGVGGLLGLNRTVRIEPLREGIRNNAVDNIMFPSDPIANAMRIISDLRQIFPPEEGRFIFGPMLKFGWGTPTLISLEMGLIIEVPSPVRVAILGVLKMLLPDEEVALLRLQVNFLGVIDFEKKQLSFDASIYDSRLLTFGLSGDMAVRLNWGADPNFLLTVGGFHPAYKAPAELANVRRITLSLWAGENPRLLLEAYFAVTSNTVQFGARLELYASAGSFNVYGFLGFDVLFQFSPFYFIAEIGAGLALRSGTSVIAGIFLNFALSGPTPWNARGTASLKILFFKVSVSFNETWGETRDTTLPDVAVLPKLLEALAKKDNWRAELPAQSGLQVTVRDLAALDDVIIHPAGTLIVSQKIVPLDITIQKFGNTKPQDADRFTISSVSTGATLLETNKVRDQFAPAQYLEMSDSEKLSRKSFEKMVSGAKVRSSEKIKATHVVGREIKYEQIIIDRTGLRLLLGLVVEKFILFSAFLQGNAVAKSAFGSQRRNRSPLAASKAAVTQESFVVVRKSDLRTVDSNAHQESQTEAYDYMHRLIQENPQLAESLQVVPAYEAIES